MRSFKLIVAHAEVIIPDVAIAQIAHRVIPRHIEVAPLPVDHHHIPDVTLTAARFACLTDNGDSIYPCPVTQREHSLCVPLAHAPALNKAPVCRVRLRSLIIISAVGNDVVVQILDLFVVAHIIVQALKYRIYPRIKLAALFFSLLLVEGILNVHARNISLFVQRYRVAAADVIHIRI